MGEILAAMNLPLWVLYVVVAIIAAGGIAGIALTVGMRYGQMKSVVNEFDEHKENDSEFHRELKASQTRIHARVDEVQRDVSATRTSVAHIEGLLEGWSKAKSAT